MKRLFTLVTVFLLLLASTTIAPAQTTSNAELRGQVTDPNGAAVAGATVTATDTGKGTSRTVTSDANGNYVILALLPNSYDVKVEATGFAAKSITSVILQVGQQFDLPIQLGISVGAQVDVVGSQEDIVETERTQQSSVITTRQIENLPINRRNFLDFALLTPGVNDSDNINDTTDARVAQTPTSGLSFGGNNGRGNSITVDGAGADTASGGTREVLSQEGVQEFQVNRNAYAAEFGGASGGIVNIVSKTGSNGYRGSIFGYFRNKKFDARNVFDRNSTGKSPFSRQQFGGSLGGPIVKNKTFFFLSAEGLNQKQTAFVNFSDTIGKGLRIAPSNAQTDQGAFLSYLAANPNFAPLAAGLRNVLTVPTARTRDFYASATREVPLKNTNAVISGRIDHTFNESDNGFIRLNYGDSRADNQATGALTAISRGRKVDSRNGGILLSETHIFNPTTINEVKAQFSYYDLNVIPNDPIGPEINIDGFGNFGRDIFLESRNIDRRYEISDTVSLVRGNHTLKIGGLFQITNVPVNSETFLGGTFRFGSLPLALFIPVAARGAVAATIGADARAGRITPQQAALLGSTLANSTVNSLQAFNASLPQVYQQGFGNPFLNLYGQRFAVFGQDTWKVRPNITVNYGLRYYLQNEADPVPLDKNNFQPRAGFSWDIFNNAKTVLRAGAGIFTGPIDFQVSNVVNTLASGTEPFNINIVVATATSLPGQPLNQNSIAIYQTFLAQGILGIRVPTAADIAQFGLSTAPGRPLEARIRIGQNYQNPESYQASGAVQQDLGGGFSAELSYLFLRGVHNVRPVDVRQYRVTGVSAYSGQQTLAAIAPAGSPYPRALDAEYQSVANSTYNAGTLQVTKRFSNNYSINANYTYSKSIDEATDFNTDFLAQNPFNTRDDRSLSAFDQRHKLVLSGVINSPFENVALKDFVVSPIFNYGSGRPFNLLIGADALGLGNNDSRTLNDRPALAGRNTGKGDAFYSFDLRVGRRFFAKDTRYLELTFEGFNLFNTVNFNGINNIVGTACVADFRSNPNCPSAGNTNPLTNSIIPINARPIRGNGPTDPLGFTSASASRQLQFGIRYNF